MTSACNPTAAADRRCVPPARTSASAPSASSTVNNPELRLPARPPPPCTLRTAGTSARGIAKNRIKTLGPCRRPGRAVRRQGLPDLSRQPEDQPARPHRGRHACSIMATTSQAGERCRTCSPGPAMLPADIKSRFPHQHQLDPRHRHRRLRGVQTGDQADRDRAEHVLRAGRRPVPVPPPRTSWSTPSSGPRSTCRKSR